MLGFGPSGGDKPAQMLHRRIDPCTVLGLVTPKWCICSARTRAKSGHGPLRPAPVAVLDSLHLPSCIEDAAMTTPRFLDEIGSKLSELAANSPARDIEKNIKVLLGSAFGKLDLVTREEFEVQREVLAHARRKLAELEARVAELEARGTGGDGKPSA